MPYSISLQQYENQNPFQTFSRVVTECATGSLKNAYTFFKVVGGALKIPLILMPGSFALSEGLQALVDRCKVIKDIHDAFLFIPVTNEWWEFGTSILKEKDASMYYLPTVRRVFHTAGAILKTVVFVHACSICDLGVLASCQIGGLGVLNTITDSVFFVFFTLGAIINGIKIYQSSEKLEKVERIHGKWENDRINLATFKQDRQAKLESYNEMIANHPDQIAELQQRIGNFDPTATNAKSKSELVQEKEEKEAELKKANKKIEVVKTKAIAAEALLDTDEGTATFESIRAKKIDSYHCKVINTSKEHGGYWTSFLSCVGKMVVITLSILAVGIFGLQGIPISIAIGALALVADQFGLWTIAFNTQKIDEKRSIEENEKLRNTSVA